MGDSYPPPIVFDATVLSNFASSDSVDLLVELFSAPTTTPAVVAELERGIEHGHEFLTSAVSRCDDSIEVRATDRNTDSVDRATVRNRLDAGEAEAFLTTLDLDGTIATDDLAARELAREHGAPVTGSIGILVVGIERGRLDPSTANEWLAVWREERGYFAPVDRIEDVLDDV